MAWLAAAIPAALSLYGSISGNNAQKAAASDAANGQLRLEQQQYDQLQKGEAAYRQQIQQMLPYLGAPVQAAQNIRNQSQYLAPGQGSMFGGQQLGQNGSVQMPNQGFQDGMRTMMPPNSNYLAQNMPQNSSGVPAFNGMNPIQGGSQTLPGSSGGTGMVHLLPSGSAPMMPPNQAHVRRMQ